MNRKSLYVTFVDSLGPYLKICGQLNPDALRVVRTKIQMVLPMCYSTSARNLHAGTVCLCKRFDEVCRARITAVMHPENLLQVEYIDYGYTILINSNEVYIPQFPDALEQIPPLCSTFIMLGILSDWSKEDLQEISRLIVNQSLEISVEMELNQFKFIQMKWREFNFAEYLILQKKIGAPVQNEILRDNFVRVMNKTQYPAPVVGNAAAAMCNNNSNNSNMSIYANREIMMKRPIPARQLHPTTMNNSRYPNAFGNLHSMVQGFQHQNTRIPYTGPPHEAYSPRYNRPVPPAPLESQRSPSKRGPATFKSNTLVVGNTYDVCCSFVENGPCLFSVQLMTEQAKLTEMMNKIESVQLKALNDKPMLGTACIARYSEDGQLYRALITGVQPTACKVSYIDYGNAEIVQFRDLYEIPEEYLTHKAFAIRFTLSGYKELEPIDESLKKAFKEMVLFKNCSLKVMPLEGPPLVQYCELRVSEKNVFETLKQIQRCRLVFPKAEGLVTNDVVEIRYIDSPKHFYVQKISNIEEFEQMMDDMFVYYNKKQVVPNHLAIGTPCMVKYDNEWYRAEVMRADGMTIVVRHVDFGYEQKVTKNLLSTVSEKHLKLPRQAIQCCLKGFENNEMTRDLATTQFEMLAEESNRSRRSFTVKVFRVQPNGAHLVNLCTKDLNVMKKLYKLSMPFDQYISMEKEEFNNLSNGYDKKPPQQQQQQLAPVVTQNQNQQHPALEAKKSGSYQNSTGVQCSDERSVNRNSQNSIEWDKNSSSSLENRDSRSSSSEHKTRKYPQQQQVQLRGNRDQRSDRLNKSTSSSDKRSSYDESKKHDKLPFIKVNKNIPPRFLNAKIQQQQQESPVDNRRQLKPSNTNNQQKFKDRPQYPAEGYSQSKKQQHSAASTSSQRDSADENGVVEVAVVEEYVPLDKEFVKLLIDVPAREEVMICWWISPHQFYTHLKSRNADFEKLMRRIQTFYRNKPIKQLSLKVGANVIARYRKDNILYRARIIACNQMLRKYKVLFVDFGNQSTVGDQDIWQVEKRFADFPQMAYLCCFDSIVSNYDNSYIIEHMDKYLPAGAGLQCEYLEREEDLYYVNVSVNGSSLKVALVRDGLLSEVCPDTRLELLSGQQIRAKITSINNMLNFKIQIEGCDVKLLCSYDDIRYVKSNPDMAKKFKKFYDGKSCVLNISHVTDDKVLMVRPMLPLLQDDISTTIYICPYPIIWEKFNIRVVYVSTVQRLYGHLISAELQLAQLLDEMFCYYDKNGNPLEKYEVDTMCAVNSATDGNWYRARILSKKSADNINVLYVDYGNTEIIDNSTKTKLKRLEPRFYTDGPSAFAIEVNLPMKCVSETNPQTVIDEIKSLTADHELSVKVIEMRGNRLIGDLCSNDQGIVTVLKEKGLTRGRDMGYIRSVLDKEPSRLFEYIETVDLTIENDEEAVVVASQNSSASEKNKSSNTVVKAGEKAAKEKVVSSPKKEKKAEKSPVKVETVEIAPIAVEEVVPEPPEDPYKNMESGMLSHCDNPGRFFIHHSSKLDELHQLQENLQIVASSLPPLMRVLKGANCISLYSVDHQWYRAKIMDSELMVVQFIDYGNTDALTDTTDIKEMSVFPNIAPLCIPCALPIKPKGTTDWVDAANAFFNVSYNKTIYFEYITKSPTKNFIRLIIDGVNVADKLVADGFAKHLEMVPSGETCFVSHVNNLSDFYIQMDQDAKALDLIESYLADNKKLPVIDTFTHGLICAALFPDDENWYRAKLMAKRDNGFEVLFIDYGNTAVSPQVKAISQEIANLPFLSKKCALQLPEDVLCWSDAAEEKFFDIAALGETVFVVELKEPSDHAIVHLSVDGKNIIEELEPLCDRKPNTDNDMNTSFYTTMQSSMSESYRNGTRDAIISHANSPCDFYVQYNSDGHKLDDMTTTLNEITMNKIENPEVGMLCAAVFPEDGALYRSKILGSCGENSWRVIFIDFGNESVTTDIRMLPDDLRCIKEFSKHCTLENGAKFSTISASVEVFNVLIDECGGIVKIDVVNDECDPAVVKLYGNDENLCEKLNRLLGIDASQESSMRDALVSHVISPSEFYVQLKFERVGLEKISKMLETAGDMAKIENPNVGELCAVFSKEDEIYNRGKVIKTISDGEFEVLLIDFGNTTVASDLRRLPAELQELQGIARRCRLHPMPEGDENTLKERFSSVLEAHFGEIFQIEPLASNAVSDDEILSVNLLIRDKNIAEELKNLMENGKTEPETAPVDDCRKCIVIQVTSPNDFYIQFTDDGPQVEKITERLMDAASLEPLENPQVGAICVAQFPEDEAYYRAKILSVQDKDCEVIYLDFGNTAVTDQIRKIPEDMVHIEPAGKHCALEKPAGVDFWSDDVSFRFSELIDSRFSETFQVEVLRKSTDPWLVRLFYQETDIITELQNQLKAPSKQNSVVDDSKNNSHEDVQ